MKQSVSSRETKCFTPRNGLFQALKQFLKLIATGEEMVKLLPFTHKLLIHRGNREKVKGELKRWEINIQWKKLFDSVRNIRGEWESGIVEAYLNGELEEENENGNQSDRKTVNSSSTSQYPPYVPVGNNDTWLSYYDAETNFSCQYPTNWRKITGAKGLTPSAEPPLLRLVNGANQLTVTALTYDTQKEFEHIKKLSLTLPRNAQGEPAEDYKQSNVNINGLSMTRTTNPLHIGAPDEPGEDIQQIVLHYFQESKKRTFTIVMLVYDEEAETDLNAITSSIQITQ